MHHLHHRLGGRPSPDNQRSSPRVCTIPTTKLDTHPHPIADDLAQERAPSPPLRSTLTCKPPKIGRAYKASLLNGDR
eukprot:852087-Rhodomonas_salina.1